MEITYTTAATAQFAALITSGILSVWFKWTRWPFAALVAIPTLYYLGKMA